MAPNDDRAGRPSGNGGGRSNRNGGGGRGGRNGGGRPGGHNQRRGPADGQNRPPGPGEFLNPYTFAPTPPRAAGTTASAGQHPDGLNDGAPAPHGRLAEGLWSGSITLSLHAATPWLIPDAARRTEGPAKHFTYDLRTRETERGQEPIIPVTTVKGALRAAYELVTNSRYGVFQGHDHRLGYRMDARRAPRLVPARVNEKGDLQLLLGVNDRLLAPGDRNWFGPAAWLPTYRSPQKVDQLPSLTHGTKVKVWLEKRERTAGRRFKFVRVTKVEHDGVEHITSDPVLGEQRYRNLGLVDRPYEGWVFRTNANVGNKHDERVFFGRRIAAAFAGGRNLRDLAEFYEGVCRSYQNAHDPSDIETRTDKNGKRVGPEVFIPPGKPGDSAWSPHLYAPKPGTSAGSDDRRTMFEKDEHGERIRRDGEPVIKTGFLCYARLDSAGEVDGLFPVNIARDLWPDTPEDLLDESLRPAAARDELSPADRVFGWVAPKGSKNTAAGERGRLRIRAVDCTDPAAALGSLFDPPLPLAILGAPKPTQAGFYVGDADGRPRSARDEHMQTAYSAKNALRGRKVYWHQASSAAYWEPADATRAQPREYLRPDGKPDSQNRSIKRWIEPGASFTVDIEVTNLSEVELGALLYLASLGDGRCALHVGGAKPLGFGSARVSIAGHGLVANAEMRRAYRDLDEPTPATDEELVAVLDAFRTAIGDGPLDLFEHLATPQQAPVHYPRPPQPGRRPGDPVPADVQHPSFEWFRDHRGTPLPAPRDSDTPGGRLPY